MLKYLIGAFCILAAALGTQAQGLDNPVTKAMMEVYDAEVAADPNNYEVRFKRANEYYKYNQYLRALTDVDAALASAPANDTDFRFEAFTLRGQIYQMLGKHQEALDNFVDALKLDPTSFQDLYQKANSEYELGRYADAKADYNRMRAINPRSAEALTGLARVAIKENNIGLASEYMDDAIALMPADSDVYVRRSKVRASLANNTGAVDDLLMAISIDSSPKAFQLLTDMATRDYPAVITGLSNAVRQAPEQGMFYYIRGVIQQAHNHFPGAIADFQKIIDENMYNYAGIYGNLAECYLGLCEYDKALEAANQAVGMTANNAPYRLVLSKIYLAQGKKEQALEQAREVVDVMAADVDAQCQLALCLFAAGKYDEAADIYASLAMDHPENPFYTLLQAWVVNDGLKQERRASEMCRRAARALDDQELSWQQRKYQPFLLLFGGSQEEAEKKMEEVLRVDSSTADTDGSLSYFAACFFAQSGATDKALDCTSRALDRGYSNLYEWKVLTGNGRVNVAPMRKNQQFQTMLTNYSYIFE